MKNKYPDEYNKLIKTMSAGKAKAKLSRKYYKQYRLFVNEVGKELGLGTTEQRREKSIEIARENLNRLLNEELNLNGKFKTTKTKKKVTK